jgi:hypothetical protein
MITDFLSCQDIDILLVQEVVTDLVDPIPGCSMYFLAGSERSGEAVFAVDSIQLTQ